MDKVVVGAEGSFVNSIIGEGAKFSGDIELSGLIRIDGDFSGSINKADKVLIGKTGRVKSLIKSRVVVVGGAVLGNIYSEERISILSGAFVIGNLRAPDISIERGAVFHGLCEVKQDTPGSHDEPESKQIAGGSFSVKW